MHIILFNKAEITKGDGNPPSHPILNPTLEITTNQIQEKNTELVKRYPKDLRDKLTDEIFCFLWYRTKEEGTAFTLLPPPWYIVY